MVLEAFPNAPLKISAKISTKISEKCEFWPPTWSPGRETSSPFWHHFRPWGTLGGQNGPKTHPKSLRDPSRPQFYMIFDRLLNVFNDFEMHPTALVAIMYGSHALLHAAKHYM